MRQEGSQAEGMSLPRNPVAPEEAETQPPAILDSRFRGNDMHKKGVRIAGVRPTGKAHLRNPVAPAQAGAQASGSLDSRLPFGMRSAIRGNDAL